ncbi:MAG: hypothetical protein A3F33_02780 [Candidatus Woykebacteria bacterium RIFCSPHIGHO2_12_FULL_43_10]|uniref:FtsK domain-containing protein n=1 Tax=Candidatus Woykebacteria bacterium RIFCSPLOWO2_01_FULL_43_14 TaxID=1802605 RepID=A0A1G1WXI0_9BACT|nr:MAG: hypothetical protein A2802_02295 [Candidatus Woykebacteria bacterium RIFCSPHIGHO2_01_FULL_43_29]OGY29750.1 MAG: hypothetical protein A3F33_02780 [Candidatus Woykebacteria bacterium RIFCSPHIGHO2_12_FULL_43_10]OGY32423.1 MAG: hypothetical protein A3A61_00510 [Candidatus Woykebacteria bacterium RIFCSPLOWO2_01_FULL_43_14]
MRIRRRRAYKSRSPFKFKLKKQTFRSIAALSLIAASALTFLSFFGNGGMAQEIRIVLEEYFGWAAVSVPVLAGLSGVLLTKLRIPFITFNIVGGSGLLIAMLLGLSGLGGIDSSGKLGGYLSNISSLIFSPVGAFVLFAFGVVFSLVIIFNTSLEDAVKILIGFVALVIKPFQLLAKVRLPNFSKVSLGSDKLPFITKGLRSNLGNDKRSPNEDKSVTPAIATQVVSSLPMENKVWEYPPLDLLSDQVGGKANRGDIKQNAAIIEKTLESFGIQARVVEVNFGPAVTQYALEIALGTKLTKITALGNDIALALAAPTGAVRIEAPIPGKSLVGIEVPNISPEIVVLKSILASPVMQKAKSKLAFALGLDISGEPIVSDIAKMPHCLIAGSTGSGKSVCINALIASLLFRTTPSELRLIMVDPKIVELSVYNGIPHLLTPVITESAKVLSALKWAMGEMDRRYKLFAEVGSRNIESYNEMSGFQAIPYIVIIIDELADLMMFAPVEVEDSITRIAQMARATGMHLVLATQRPSVDIITGVIKANIPTRLAFNVTSQVDSRVIIDQPGAEKLLGKGDMLYVPPDASKPQRIQGAFVAEHELNKLLEFLKKSGEPQYTEEVTTQPISRLSGKGGGGSDSRDELFEEAVRAVCQYDRASASLLQRRLRVGYARAARMLDELEMAGVVGNADGSKARDVLIKDAEAFLSGGQNEG